MSEKRKYFGTDGIRGTIGTSPLTADFMLKLGNAVGKMLRKGTQRPTVIIGKDTRISGYMIESALEAGFISAGVNVLLSGPLPTPGIAYLTRAMRLDLGVVISASHNPFADNGIKFFAGDGRKMTDQWEVDVEKLLLEPMMTVPSMDLGKAERIGGAPERYIEFCKSTFDSDLSLKGLKIVVDAAHGAAYQTASATFHELGAEVISIACEPNGININDGVGATHPEAIVAAVKAHGADYGISLDGDADRLQMVDNNGRLYNGDEILYLMTLDRIAADGKNVQGVVGTLMTNMAVEVALKRLGVELVRANVGDRYVLAELHKRGWHLGGESSGHLLDLSRHTTGDGTMSALLVLQAVARSGQSMEKMLYDLELYPQTMINVKIPRGASWNTPAVDHAKKHVEKQLGDTGRVLLRASGTEPLVRVMVEAQDADFAKVCAEHIAQVLEESTRD